MKTKTTTVRTRVTLLTPLGTFYGPVEENLSDEAIEELHERAYANVFTFTDESGADIILRNGVLENSIIKISTIKYTKPKPPYYN